MKKETNIDLDEQNDGVSYEKGREFEEQFASFMRNELRWDKVRVGAHMTGRNNAKGTSIDVFAERLDERGMKYRKYADNWMLASGGFGVFSLVWFLEQWSHHGIWFFRSSMVVLLVGLMFRYFSEGNNKQNAWVECKNLKGRSNINHIKKMLSEYQDYKASKNDNHKFTHLYFVSANGYVENALKMAMDNNIICYTKKGNSFIETRYWDEKDNKNS